MVDHVQHNRFIEAYFKGVRIYAKPSLFVNKTQYEDDNQRDKYSHNFIYLSQPTFNPETIRDYFQVTQ